MPSHVETRPSFVSVSEAAIALQVSSATVRRWIKSGHLHAAQPGGRDGLVRIPVAELTRLAEGRPA